MDASPNDSGPLRFRAPRRIRTGPVAAGVAGLMVLSMMAVPKMPAQTPEPPAVAVKTFNVGALPGEVEIPVLEFGPGMGAGLGRFDLLTEATWEDFNDHTAAVSVELVSSEDEAARLRGSLRFRRRIGAANVMNDVDAVNVLARATGDSLLSLGGLGDLGGVEESDERGVRYLSVGGELVGSGTLEGTTVTVRGKPGSVVRRGPWRIDGDGAEVVSVIARVEWYMDGTEPASIDPVGDGTLAIRLARHRLP